MNNLYQLGTVYDCAPKWFEVLRANYPDVYNNDAGVDHVRHYRNVAILQPYHAQGRALVAMIQHLEENGYVVTLSGTTNYYVGATFTIFAFKPSDQHVFQTLLSQTRKTEIIAPQPRDGKDGGVR